MCGTKSREENSFSNGEVSVFKLAAALSKEQYRGAVRWYASNSVCSPLELIENRKLMCIMAVVTFSQFFVRSLVSLARGTVSTNQDTWFRGLQVSL